MRRLIVVLGIVAAWWWWRGGHTPAPANPPELQAAVLRNGFALRVGSRVVEISRKGKPRTEHTVAPADFRLVGTRSGPMIGWLDTRKLRLAKPDGTGGSVWGKSARMLCEGTATNDARFAVGWLEADNTVWFVHGPTTDASAALGEPEQVLLASEPATAPIEWCGLASAEQNVALLWRERDRLFIGACTAKKCMMPASVAFDRRDTLLGFGCVRNACLLGWRERTGKSKLAYVTESGSVKWTRPLATDQLAVSIVGAGADAFAVGYATSSASDVVRVDRKGTITNLWHSDGAAQPPALAWSQGQLLVGRAGGEPTLISFPK